MIGIDDVAGEKTGPGVAGFREGDQERVVGEDGKSPRGELLLGDHLGVRRESFPEAPHCSSPIPQPGMRWQAFHCSKLLTLHRAASGSAGQKGSTLGTSLALTFRHCQIIYEEVKSNFFHFIRNQ